jgi:hypothetical protein
MTEITDKNSFLFYGRSGVGKSTQAKYIAQYVYDKWGKKTRYLALDTGSLWKPVQKLIDAGIVEPLLVPTAPEFNPMATMRKLRRGEWPQDNTIKQSEKIGLNNWKNPNVWLPWTDKNTAEIGAYFVDSITEYANALLYDSRAKNVRGGNDSGPARVEDGEQAGMNTQTHYAEAQSETCAGMTAFFMLPIHIAAFTALEDTGQEDVGGVTRPTLGPMLVGQKAITKAPARVLNNIRMVSEGVGSKRVVRGWYEEHPSAIATMKWPSKIALEPEQWEEFWKIHPNGYIPLTLEKGIGEFLEFLNRKKA